MFTHPTIHNHFDKRFPEVFRINYFLPQSICHLMYQEQSPAPVQLLKTGILRPPAKSLFVILIDLLELLVHAPAWRGFKDDRPGWFRQNTNFRKHHKCRIPYLFC